MKALAISERLLIEVAPAALVEAECLGLIDGGAGFGLPCQGAQAGIGAVRDRGIACLDPVQGHPRHASRFGSDDCRDAEGLAAFAQAGALGHRHTLSRASSRPEATESRSAP